MTAPVLLIHGTWGRANTWYRRGSPFVQALEAQGLELFHDEPFLWSGRIGGLPEVVRPDPSNPDETGGRLEWANEGRHLTYYAAALRPGVEVSIVAHSHGGQLAALAIARGGLKVRHLITVATPVRWDMQEFYSVIPQVIRGSWVHVYGDWWRDWAQKLGELGDGYLGWYRKMPSVTNLHADGAGHSSTLQDNGEWFTKLGLWKILREEKRREHEHSEPDQ